MDPVFIVSGKWIKKYRYVFNPDSRGCRVLHLDEETTHEEFSKCVLDDYRLNELSHEIQLSYMFSNKSLKKMAHDTPPVYVSNNRQLQGFLSLKKSEQLRLCVEIMEKKDVEMNRNDRAREKSKTLYSFSSEVEVSDVESRDENHSLEDEREDNENDCCSKVEGETQNESGEDVVFEEDEDDDEFESRFDMFDDSDGASSEDDNFSSNGESPTQEDSPTLPSKQRTQNYSTSGCSGNPEVLKLEMSSLNLCVGQRYENKDDLERRLKLLTVRD